ncbi:YbaB/EbfC family nucleoid-associated protein [Amycolatopsis sp. NPDC004079]|uniref:YbaB/EbfC family nucleoid-associated protein n=1 Tax=Amycolatopsis sp. NPDC004079 TaxID=3154549 RepID=UPI0033BC0EC1
MNETARQLLARIEAIDTAAKHNERNAETYRMMAEELQEAQGTAMSPDGVVTVVAGAGGGINSITFGERVREAAPEALSASVMRAIAEAQAKAARLQAEVVRRNLGSTEVLDRVLDSDEQLFGAQRPSAVVPHEAPAASARPAAEKWAEEEYEEVALFDDGDEPRR